MASKRKLLKWGVISLVVVLFAGWFGFTTFFFNPLEDDYEYDVSTLIPRNVDFYLAKADLSADLDAELRLRVEPALEESPSFQALVELPEVQELLARVDWERLREDVRAQLAALPIAVDPLELFGGRDLALAGNLKGPGPEGIDWAVLGRANWMGKLGVALLGYPGLLKLEQQGLEVEEVSAPGDGHIAYLLRGGRLVRPLYVHRVQDVIVVGTDVELFRQIPALARQRGQDSFGLSARYEDRINVVDREGDEVELFLDYRALSEQQGFSGRWPNGDSPHFASAFGARLFQAGSVNDVIGRLRFGRVLALDLHSTLSSELLSAPQKRLYRHRGIDKESLLRDVASMIPADVGFFAAGTGDLADLLREALASSEDALVSNLEDLVRSVWSHADVQPLIDDLDVAFGDRFAFCMRANDYPTRENDPPHDGTVVPAWALVLWVEDEERVKALSEAVNANQASFGIHGKEPGSRGVFYHPLAQGGVLVFEYWSPLIPGTGHMSTLTDTMGGGAVFVLSNHYALCGQINQTFFQGSEVGHPRLSEHPTFSTQVSAGLPAVNLVAWVNAGPMQETLRGMAQRWAKDSVAIDWETERPRIEKKVLAEKMPGAVYGELSPEEEEELAMLAQPELDAFEQEVRGRQGSRLELELNQRIGVLAGLQGVLLEVGLDKAEATVALRIKLPLESE